LALVIRIKPRAERQIDAAAAWWQANRPAAPGAIRADIVAALEALLEQPGIGSLVTNARDAQTRCLYLARTRYFVYYRVPGQALEVLAFWHDSREQEPHV
jgi:plasmid stabilization system protein ParE